VTRRLSGLLVLLIVSGCTLLDQKTFAPSPEAKAQTPPPLPTVPVDPRTPLVTIDYSVPAPDYAELLHYGVTAAEARDAEVQFDVISVVKDAADAAAGQERATGVMRAIMRDRVPASRVHLALRTDPALEAGQVRVYVR
jgi:hypothetical protein